MIGNLNGPWLPCVAIVLLSLAVRRVSPGLGSLRGELWLVALLTLVAGAARLAFGLWGPLHVNGQGPLWIRGALDAEALASYGPGYYELYSWVARAANRPEQAVFVANALLSAVSPALLYILARLIGVRRWGAFAAAFIMAADAVTIRTAASELYVWPQIALVLATQVSLATFVRAWVRTDIPGAGLALVAASLFAAATARIHLLGLVPLLLSPLVVLCAARPRQWGVRIRLMLLAAVVLAATVLFSSGLAIIAAWQHAPVSGQTMFTSIERSDLVLLALAAVALWALRRWAQPASLPLMALASVPLLLVVQAAFRLHPFQEQFYARLCWPGLLLGAAALVPQRLQSWRWSLGLGVAVVAALQITAAPYLGTRTTEQYEHAFLQEVLPGLPPSCALAAVERVGKRVWAIPAYLVASRRAYSITAPTSVPDALRSVECLVYVHSSLCTSVDGRSLCEAAEQSVRFERVASRTFPAAPSYLGLPYDRPEVEVVVLRARGTERPPSQATAELGAGAPISPELAQALFDRVKGLHESDGCRLMVFDTSRSHITIGLHTPAGIQASFVLGTTRAGSAGRRVGGWELAVPPELGRDCGTTIAAIEQVLETTAAPRRAVSLDLKSSFVRASYGWLSGLFVLLVIGTAFALSREARDGLPSRAAVLALVAIWAIGLGLRLEISPRTFLHEYYHIAETVPAYLTGEIGPLYGKAGPALFRLVSTLLGGEANVHTIFLTNAVVSSLAIPALALFDLALLRSWPRALCAAVLLCVLPLHLRWSASEDLYVMALTFGLWSLALFALYLRSGRLFDALLAALALALAMQVRPEMLVFPGVVALLVLCVQPRPWRLLFAWRTLVAFALLAALLIPRFLDFGQALQGGSPAPNLPDLWRYLTRLVLLHPDVTPPIYWVLLLAGLVWGLRHAPGVTLWALLVFVGYTFTALTVFDNPPYNLRSQLLPTSVLMLVGAGVAPMWMEWWGERSGVALRLGAGVLAAFATFVLVRSHGFVTELRDQQLEWSFLERTVPSLPDSGTLLAAADIGGHNLNAFPAFLLDHANKRYELVDVHRATRGEAEWPVPGEDMLYYQGMYCYFSFDPNQAVDPMTAACADVHARYELEPLFVESLDTEGYSLLRYAAGPYRIGFFRITALRSP